MRLTEHLTTMAKHNNLLEIVMFFIYMQVRLVRADKIGGWYEGTGLWKDGNAHPSGTEGQRMVAE